MPVVMGRGWKYEIMHGNFKRLEAVKSVLLQTQVEAVGAGNVPDVSESIVSHAEGQH